MKKLFLFVIGLGAALLTSDLMADFSGTFLGRKVTRDSGIEYRVSGGLITININGNFITLPFADLRGTSFGTILERGYANGTFIGKTAAGRMILAGLSSCKFISTLIEYDNTGSKW